MIIEVTLEAAYSTVHTIIQRVVIRRLGIRQNMTGGVGKKIFLSVLASAIIISLVYFLVGNDSSDQFSIDAGRLPETSDESRITYLESKVDELESMIGDLEYQLSSLESVIDDNEFETDSVKVKFQSLKSNFEGFLDCLYWSPEDVEDCSGKYK